MTATLSAPTQPSAPGHDPSSPPPHTAAGPPRLGSIGSRLIGSGLIGGLAAACGIALTGTAGWLIVSAAARPQILTLMVAIVGVRAFGIARPAFRYGERIASHDAALADLTIRRARLFAALIPLTPARLGRRRRSDLLTSLVSDLDDVVDAQVRVIVPLIATATGGTVAAVVAGYFLPAAGLIIAGLLLAAALIALADWRVQSWAQPRAVRQRAVVDGSALLAAQYADELRAIGGGAEILARLARDHEELRRAVRGQALGRALHQAALLIAVALATVALALTSFRAVRDGAVTAPIAALTVLIPVALGDVLVGLPDVVGALARSLAARRRVGALLDQRPAVAQATSAQTTVTQTTEAQTTETAPRRPAGQIAAPALQLIGITAAWHDRSDAARADLGQNALGPTGLGQNALGPTDLGPLDLRIESGERVMITGPSGCGKTTLLALIARQLDPRAGRYLIDGADAVRQNLDEVRSLFAILDDEPHLFATSLRQNLLLAQPQATDGQLRAALGAAGLAPWFAGLPNGLDTVIGADHRSLSGGETARLGLARALVSERPILLLDEPVAHLDHPTALAVLTDVLAACPQRTVIIVSHRDDATALCDRVIDLTARRRGSTT